MTAPDHPRHGLPEYLSGLLIGAEIAAAAQAGQAITILGAADLTSRYGKAAEALGLAWNPKPEYPVVAGHLQLARAARLLEQAP